MPSTAASDRVDAVRAFNRFYTNRIGALRGGLLGTRHPLPEARVLFELRGGDAMEVADLRRALDIDAGHLSRLLSRLGREGLVAREPSPGDARRLRVRLTDRGRRSFAVLDARSAAETRALLDALDDEDQRRLVEALDTVRDVLEGPRPAAPRAVALRAPRPGEHGWIVERHGALYAREYGWDARFEALVARIVADHAEHHDPAREAAWIAEVDGRAAGCVLCVRKDAAVAQLRLLLVEPSARGLGVGGRLVDECLRFARAAGYAEIMLWTNDALTAARRIYERAGFALVESERHASFGPELVGQSWARTL